VDRHDHCPRSFIVPWVLLQYPKYDPAYHRADEDKGQYEGEGAIPGIAFDHMDEGVIRLFGSGWCVVYLVRRWVCRWHGRWTRILL
jgi:hypothetical protein